MDQLTLWLSLIVAAVTAIVAVVRYREFLRKSRAPKPLRVMSDRGNVLYQDPAPARSARPVPSETITLGGDEEDQPAPAGGGFTTADVTRIVSAARGQPTETRGFWRQEFAALLVFVPAMILAVVSILGALRHDPPDVDCVAYVTSLTALVKDYPTVKVDAVQLAHSYGDNVVHRCGPPGDFLAAIGR